MKVDKISQSFTKRLLEMSKPKCKTERYEDVKQQNKLK